MEISEFGLDKLRVVERDAPRPGPRQVLVRMRALSINFRDLVVAQGGYGPHVKAPLVPLSDGAGEVIEVGSEVSRFAPGDRVTPCFFQSWSAGAPKAERTAGVLGGPLDGTAREVCVFEEEGLVHTPAYLSDAEAATLPCAGVTAWTALSELDRVRPGETVLLQGTGGVSLFGLRIAKLLGAVVILTSSSDAKLEKARGLGADHTINYRETPQWGKRAKELTGGRGVDHVVEVGGAGTLLESVRAAAPGAQINLIGVLSGAKQELSLPHVFLQELRLQGIHVGPREAFERMLRAFEAHEVHPVLDETRFAMADLRGAFAHMQAGKHFGKIAIAVS